MYFARLVSLACHDLRTPLATVSGFARTLTRMGGVEEPAARYLEMIEAASDQLAELLDDLSVVARIEGGRYEPARQEVDSLELARGAAERLAADVVLVEGEGAPVAVDPDSVGRALYSFARCLVRHGGLERLDVRVAGGELTFAPVPAEVAPIVLGHDLRDLGAAVGGRVVQALGGAREVEGATLRVRLPLAAEPSS